MLHQSHQITREAISSMFQDAQQYAIDTNRYFEAAEYVVRDVEAGRTVSYAQQVPHEHFLACGKNGATLAYAQAAKKIESRYASYESFMSDAIYTMMQEYDYRDPHNPLHRTTYFYDYSFMTTLLSWRGYFPKKYRRRKPYTILKASQSTAQHILAPIREYDMWESSSYTVAVTSFWFDVIHHDVWSVIIDHLDVIYDEDLRLPRDYEHITAVSSYLQIWLLHAAQKISATLDMSLPIAWNRRLMVEGVLEYIAENLDWLRVYMHYAAEAEAGLL